MIRQITLIEFKAEVRETEIRALSESFAQLTEIVPGLHRFEFGRDLELEETTLDYALVIDFGSAEDWRAYLEHPDHAAFATAAMPLIERVERVQYQLAHQA